MKQILRNGNIIRYDILDGDVRWLLQDIVQYYNLGNIRTLINALPDDYKKKYNLILSSNEVSCKSHATCWTVDEIGIYILLFNKSLPIQVIMTIAKNMQKIRCMFGFRQDQIIDFLEYDIVSAAKSYDKKEKN